MARLSERIDIVLNETRMLLLGGQVLVGFSYRICFEHGFERIPAAAQIAQVAGLGIMTAGLGWLIWPAAFHQIAERGAESATIYRFTTRILDWALLPLAIGLGLTLYPVCSALHLAHARLIASSVGVFALAMWYAWAFVRFDQRKRFTVHEGTRRGPEGERKNADISDRIKKLLIECRMALPGAQAFLGFQFAIVFADSFEKLPRSSHWVHLGSLLATTVSIVLLIAVAAYHRLAEGGEDTEHFYKVGSRFLIAALVFLAPGMTGDLFVVIRLITGSPTLSAWLATSLLVAFYGIWFGISWWRAKSRRIG